ncbi:L-seryl-tRNA(Sec) kinase isoform X1 [Gracilinanus agilis]|uniref:L-seryl-tRNA(Sec) kinase isoform X1 n=1 Tax=Gracilinanus agilis TaxID=191870 RepID=UPI001CFED251|nr:L-seryl-tRNA(Sec) kinase isoform X1 [Gracilinanus agilis]
MKREESGEAESEGGYQLGLCVLCGLPASGKSTLARSLSDQLRRKQGWDVAVITYDDIIPEAFFEGENGPTLSSQWKSFRQELLMYLERFLMTIINRQELSAPITRTGGMWERFVDCLKNQGLICSGTGEAQCYSLTNTTLSLPLYLILDDNFYYQSMRYEIYQLARKYSLGYCQLFLDCPVESCLERNKQRSKPLPDETIQLMARKIESPNIEKNTWEHKSLVIRSRGSGSEDSIEVTDLLTTALKNPIKCFEENMEQKETDRIICSTNILHQADQTFRRIISQTMKKAKDEKVIAYKLKLLAEELTKLKADFLEDLRHGNSQKIPCSCQNSISDIIHLFHYERDNIVHKYIPKEY